MTYFCFGNGNSRKDLDLDKFKQHGTVIGCNAIYRDYNPDILVALDTGIAHEIYRSGYVFKNTTYLGYWTPIPIMVVDDLLNAETGPVSLSPSDLDFTHEAVYHGDENEKGITYVTGVLRPDKVVDIEPGIPVLNKDIGYIDEFAYATGTRAIYLACELGATEVYIIGHDLYSADDKINNIYAGTRCYHGEDSPFKRPDNPEKDDLNHWIKQHKNTFDTFKDTKFYKVNPNPIGTSPIDIVISEWHDCNNLEYITFNDLDKKFKL
jgi:hypothetical protein